MTRPKLTLPPEELLESIARRLSSVYLERYRDQSVRDLRALYELCQQQRAALMQWEEICQMRCPGTRGVAEIIRSIGE